MFGCFLKGFALIEIRLFIGFCCPILHTSYWRDFIEQHYKAGDRVGVFLCVCHTTHHVRTFIEQLLRLSCKLFSFFYSWHWDQKFEFGLFSPSVAFERMRSFVFFSLSPKCFFFFFGLASMKTQGDRYTGGFYFYLSYKKDKLLWVWLLMGFVNSDCWRIWQFQ